MAREDSHAAGRAEVGTRVQSENPSITPDPNLRLMTDAEVQQSIARQEANRKVWASDNLAPDNGVTEGRNFRKPGPDRQR